MDKRQAIGIVKNYLSFLYKKNFKIQDAYIFGSFATGKNQIDSDIDLAIILKDTNDIFGTQVRLMDLRRNRKELMIEPHPIKKADFNLNNPVVYEIMKYGIKM